MITIQRIALLVCWNVLLLLSRHTHHVESFSIIPVRTKQQQQQQFQQQNPVAKIGTWSSRSRSRSRRWNRNTNFVSSLSSQEEEKEERNVNFVDWISDAPDEVERTQLMEVEGTIPSYVKGTLMRNGCALWSSKNGSQMFSHIFDGLAKVSAYDININGEDDNGNGSSSIYFQTKFIRSNWYEKVTSSDTIPPFITIGPIIDTKTKEVIPTNPIRTLQCAINAMQFDNAAVNVWDYNRSNNGGGVIMTALTDAAPYAEMALDDLSTISISAQSPPTSNTQGFELFCTTHPEYSKLEKGVTYNVGIEIGLNGPHLILTKETSSSRTVVGRAKVDSPEHTDGLPYLHSFAVNGQHATVILEPLRGNSFDIPKVMTEGYFTSMDHVDYTQIIVFDVTTGQLVMDQKIYDEKIYFYHTISATEHLDDQQTVSVRLCAYKTPYMKVNKNHQFMKLDQCGALAGRPEESKANRNKLSQAGMFCDITCHLKNSTVQVQWHSEDDTLQKFELATTRYSRQSGSDALRHRHPRYVYAYATYVHGPEDEYDAWGLYKYDTSSKEEESSSTSTISVNSFYQKDSIYPSEPIFVPDPNGTQEDDGVILSQIYDGKRRETALLVLDARTMTPLATAWTGQRSPQDFHGTWIPSQS